MEPGDVASAIAALRGDEPLLVAIDGLAGSGKTTLAGVIGARLAGGSTVVSADEFYEPEERDWRGWTAREGYERYFDHGRLERELLQPIRRGRPARFSSHDWAQHAPGPRRDVDPRGVVLVEGVYLLKPRLRAYWSATVWVETPRDTRERRLRARGERDPGWIETWMRAEDYYVRVDAPAEAATFVVSGTASTASASGLPDARPAPGTDSR